MKAVLLSIRPQHCANIASGRKTVELRKRVPKLPTPYKCYIYETRGRAETPWMDEDGHMDFHGRGQVIGEFICDKVYDYEPCDYGIATLHACVPFEDVMKYADDGLTLHGLHISDLKIYEKPRPLGVFSVSRDRGDGILHGMPLRSAPQSWCYVDEMEDLI